MPAPVAISAHNAARDSFAAPQPSPRSWRATAAAAGLGMSFTGPGSFVLSPRFGSYGKQALFGTSMGKSPVDFEMFCGSVETEHGQQFVMPRAESEFCRNYTCCGLQLADLHDLIQHYEEAHVVVLDDGASPADFSSDASSADDMDMSSSPPSTSSNAVGQHARMAEAKARARLALNGTASAFETSVLTSNPRGAPTSLRAKAPLGSFGPLYSPSMDSDFSASAPGTPVDEDMHYSFDSDPAVASMPLFPSSTPASDPPACVTPGLLFPTNGQRGAYADAAMRAYSADPTSADVVARPSSNLVNEKPFKCPNPGCSKSYRQANGLKYHRLHGQCNFVVRDGMEQDGLTLAEAEAVARPYLCQVGHCDKRYKNMNGLRYHYAHSGAHGAIGLAMLANGTHPTPPPTPAHVRERRERERRAQAEAARAARAAGLPVSDSASAQGTPTPTSAPGTPVPTSAAPTPTLPPTTATAPTPTPTPTPTHSAPGTPMQM